MQMSVELENGKFAGESASNCCDRSLYIVTICIDLLLSIQKLNKVVIRSFFSLNNARDLHVITVRRIIKKILTWFNFYNLFGEISHRYM